jgi:hypothetical protein
MSIATDVADAVVAELNGHTFEPTFEAKRKAIPEFDLDQLRELRVTIIPRSLGKKAASRTETRHTVAVDIGIQKKILSDLDTEVAELGELVDAISDYLCRRKLPDAPWASWHSDENEPIYAVEHLINHRVFTSVLTVRYTMLSE